MPPHNIIIKRSYRCCKASDLVEIGSRLFVVSQSVDSSDIFLLQASIKLTSSLASETHDRGVANTDDVILCIHGKQLSGHIYMHSKCFNDYCFG